MGLWRTNENRFPRVLLKLSDGKPPQSWRTWLFYSDDKPYTEFDLQKPWSDPANLVLGRQKFGPVLCPANFDPTDDAGRYITAYAAVTGPETAFPNGEALPLSKFSDGTAYTIIYGEVTGLRIVWTEPRDIDISREPIGINLHGSSPGYSPGTLSSHHAGIHGATVVFADGTVRFLNEKIDPAVLKALFTATARDSPFPDLYKDRSRHKRSD